MIMKIRKKERLQLHIVDIVYNLHSLMIFLKGRLLEGEIDKQ